MVQEDDVLRRETEPPVLSALHAKNDTTNPFQKVFKYLTNRNENRIQIVLKTYTDVVNR